MKVILSLLLITAFTDVFGQPYHGGGTNEYNITDTEPDRFNNIQFNKRNVNPAISDDTSEFHVSIIRQQQWSGPVHPINGSSLFFETSIPKIASGIALQFEFFGNREIGKRSAEFFYNWEVLNRNNWKISTGAGFGLTQHVMESIYIQFDRTYNLISQKSNFKSWTTDVGALIVWKNHQISVAYNNYLISTDLVDGYPGTIPRDALTQFTVGYFYPIRLNRRLYLEPELLYLEMKRKEVLAFNADLVINQNIRTGPYVDIIIPGIHYDLKRRYGLHFSCFLWHFLELGYASYFEQITGQWGGQHIFKAGFKIS